MKKKSLILLSITAALSLTGCSFFSLILDDSSVDTSEWEPVKQHVGFTHRDLSLYAYYDTDSMPTTGNPKLLVIPIWFSDSHQFIDEEHKVSILEDLNKLCFGTPEDTGWYSISSFYQHESHDTCVISGEVTSWYECGLSYDGVTSTSTTNDVIKRAVNNWKSENPEKIKEFDSDSNGYLDGVIAIYGGPNYSKDTRGRKTNSNMWAYTSWLETEANIEVPNANTYIWASYDFMYADLNHGITIDAHTYIHEMGHVFGLDDYYDYAEKGIWAGAFSMQDYNVGGHDPYSLLSLGWVEPYVPTGNATITLKPFESSGEVILLSPDFSANSPFDEYILLEYYTPTGTNEYDTKYQYLDKYPQGPNKHGIRIWHVDSRLLKITEGTTRGKTAEYYSIVNTIDPSEGKYIVGPTNTTYTGNKETDSYCSLASELRKYKLLELIRKGDNKGLYTDKQLIADYLFTSGDTFSISDYSGYFVNGTRLNNGNSFKWKVKINSVTSEEAKITVSL